MLTVRTQERIKNKTQRRGEKKKRTGKRKEGREERNSISHTHAHTWGMANEAQKDERNKKRNSLLNVITFSFPIVLFFAAI